MTERDTPYEAWIMALLSLPKMGPSRLTSLLDRHGADECWDRLCAGKSIGAETVPSDVVTEWRNAARRFDVHDRWAASQSLGIELVELGATGYPSRLVDDIEPPVLLFRLGLPIGDRPTVAIVGTRKCTSYGRRIAFELGAELAAAGVSIVSGLALGVDAAAHEGALSLEGAPPIGVVGSGLDVVYPKRNRQLWHRVARSGTLVSEAPPGAAPARWRFPARNRIIAGLADAVIVVESRACGGSLLTVDEAQLRDVPVGSIPGPITSAASAGTNQLLADGAVPVLVVDDVLMMIGHVPPRQVSDSTGAEPAVHEPAPTAPSSTDRMSASTSSLLDAIGWTPVLLEQLCSAVGRRPREVAADLEQLVAIGACVRSGPWIERVDR